MQDMASDPDVQQETSNGIPMPKKRKKGFWDVYNEIERREQAVDKVRDKVYYCVAAVLIAVGITVSQVRRVFFLLFISGVLYVPMWYNFFYGEHSPSARDRKDIVPTASLIINTVIIVIVLHCFE